MVSILFDLLAGVFSNAGYSNTLNTKKIDRHIELLKEYECFEKVYEDEKYHRLFFVNKRIRYYLQSSIRVKKMVRRKEAQKKLLLLLDKEMNI